MKASISIEQYISRLHARKKRALTYAIVYGVLLIVSCIAVFTLVLPMGESSSNLATFLAVLLILGPLFGLRARAVELSRLKDILDLLDVLAVQDNEER
jgi:hypothetical protein